MVPLGALRPRQLPPVTPLRNAINHTLFLSYSCPEHSVNITATRQEPFRRSNTSSCRRPLKTRSRSTFLCMYFTCRQFWKIICHNRSFRAVYYSEINNNLTYRRDSTRWWSFCRSGSFKVTDFSDYLTRKPVCDFLLVNNIYANLHTAFSSYRAVLVKRSPLTQRKPLHLIVLGNLCECRRSFCKS